jgi:hypothetical protein
MGENAIKTTNDTAKSSGGTGNGPEALVEWEPPVFNKLPVVGASSGTNLTDHSEVGAGIPYS